MPTITAPRPHTLRMICTLAAAPLVLALAGCHKPGSSSATATAAPVAAVTAPAGKQWSDIVAKTADNGMVMGNPNAPIKLVEYGSLSCPHCAHLAQEGMSKLISAYVNSGKVSYEYRSFAIHGIDIPLTVLVRCARPEAFFGLVEQIYATQDALIKRAMDGQTQAEAAAKLPPAQRISAVADAFGLTAWFAAHGLPEAQAHACLADTAKADAVAQESSAIGAKGINSTPTLIINGNKSSALTWPELEVALKNAGA